MVVARPLPPTSSIAVALRKLAGGEPLSDEEAMLVDASMPKLTEEELRADADVDPALELSYLAGDVAEDPCPNASS